jgi:Zn-finger nucleic acid-binding protein
MRCPDCRTTLVEIPTAQAPQIDVCPGRHGVWVDADELNLFVENHAALQAQLASDHDAIRRSGAACVRCGSLMDERRLGARTLFSCRSCREYWLPQGTLTHLHAAYRGAVAIRFQEADFYTRAAARESAAERVRLRSARAVRTARLSAWIAVFGIGFLALGWWVTGHVLQSDILARWLRRPDQAVVFLCAGVFGGVALFVHGFQLSRRKQLLEATPTSRVRSLAVGLVEVTGTAKAGAASLAAPFSGVPCVLFSYHVRERKGSGRNGRWVTMARGQSDTSFWLDDGSGAILIDPSQAELVLNVRHRYDNTGWKELPPAVERALASLGISTSRWLGRTKVRCSESAIVPGERVYVLGTAQERREPVLPADNASRLFIGHHSEQAFIIADRDELALASSLRWRMVGFLWGGPILTLACAWALLTWS